MAHRGWLCLFLMVGCGSSGGTSDGGGGPEAGSAVAPDAGSDLEEAGCPHAQSALTISPTNVDFGSVQVNTNSSPRSFRLQNVAGQPLAFTPVVVFGAADFVVEKDGCGQTALAPGSTCEVQVAFRPGTVGVKNAALTARAQAGCAAGEVTAVLAGTGVSDGPSISLPPIDFGSVAVGADSTPVTRTITNTGAMPTGPLTAEVQSDQFRIQASTCVQPLEPGASCGVTVIFHPTSPGAKSGTLTVRSTDGSSATAALAGTGTPPVDPGAARLTISKETATFGPSAGCEPAERIPFHIANTGGTPTGALTTTVIGPFAAIFNGCSVQSLAPGASCELSVRYAPQSAGQHTGMLIISANPGGEVRAALTGSAIIADALSVSPIGLDFSTAPVGASSPPKSITISNTSAYRMTFPGKAEVSTAEFLVVKDGCGQSVLLAGGTCEVQVAFKPSSASVQTAVLKATATGCGGGAVQVTLQGTGTP